jgi:hypothetical protein
VLGWDYLPGSTINPRQPGKRFVRVDLLLVNSGAQPASISPALRMSLRDSTGQKYVPNLRALAASGKSAPSGEIDTGERLQGSLGFEVDEAAQGLIFVYDPSLFSSGKVLVTLGAQPAQVGAPSIFPGEAAPAIHREGEEILIGNLIVIVTSAKFIGGKPYNQPASGNRFLLVDLSVENHGANPTTFSSLLQVSVKDASGAKYAPNLMATAAGGGIPPDGELAAGERMRGQLGFEVPDQAQGLQLVLDADIWGFGKAFIALNP